MKYEEGKKNKNKIISNICNSIPKSLKVLYELYFIIIFPHKMVVYDI